MPNRGGDRSEDRWLPEEDAALVAASMRYKTMAEACRALSEELQGRRTAAACRARYTALHLHRPTSGVPMRICLRCRKRFQPRGKFFFLCVTCDLHNANEYEAGGVRTP